MLGKTPLFQFICKALSSENEAITSTLSTFTRKRVSRRHFLQSLAIGAGVVASSGILGQYSAAATDNFEDTPNNNTRGSNDIIIIGAGTAGLTMAYRLLKAGKPCQIFEASGRVGGRMKTLENFNKDGMFCELGGELVDTGHEDLQALCKELDLPLQGLKEESENVLYYFDGRHYNTDDIIDAFEPVAKKLSQDLQRAFPDGEIEVPSYQSNFGLQFVDRTSLEDYLDHIEMASWFKKLLKVAYEGEYGLPVRDQSALNLLLLISPNTDDGFEVFGSSDEAYRIQGGNEQLPKALLKAITPFVPIQKQMPLRAIRAIKTKDSDEYAFELTFANRKASTVIQAKHVVFALPWTILRQIEGIQNLPLSTVKQQAIQELGYGTNSKLMLGFKKRFWQDKQDFEQLDGLYTDLPSMSFWETSRGQKGDSAILTNFMGAEAGKWASSGSQQQALADLSEILGDDSQSVFDKNKALANWSQHPWTQASYSCPKPGQYTKFLGCQSEPECNDQLYFVGEHCSIDYMGFMNGAVESANNAFALLEAKLNEAASAT